MARLDHPVIIGAEVDGSWAGYRGSVGAFSVGQRIRVVRATGRDDLVEGDVGVVFGFARYHVRVLFLPSLILSVAPWMVRPVRIEADRLG